MQASYLFSFVPEEENKKVKVFSPEVTLARIS